MNKYTNAGSISHNQSSASEWLRDIRPLPRLALGLFVCAVVALYTPLLLIALTGSWVNVLTMWLPNTIGIALLIILNLVGNKTGRIMLLGVVLAVLLDCYIAQLTARTWTLGEWKGWWQNFAFVSIAFPLNAFLFLQYKRAADL